MLEDAESTMASSLGKEMRLTNPSREQYRLLYFLTDQIEFIENIFLSVMDMPNKARYIQFYRGE